MFLGLILLLLAVVLGPASASQAITPLHPPLNSRTIFQFANNGSWIEKVAMRRNGDLIFTTLLPAPQLYALHNLTSDQATPELIWQFPDMTGLLGITEVSHDVFAVVGGKFQSTSVPIPGTFSIWVVNFNSRGRPQITKIMDVPPSLYANGLEAVPGRDGVLMLSNSLGSLHRVDLKQRTITLVAQVPEMRPAPNAALPLGINGIKIRDGYIYWGNCFAATIYRLPIDSRGLIKMPLQVETVALLPWTFVGDFAMGPDGTFYTPTNPNNTVDVVRPDGSRFQIIAGSQQSVDVAGATATIFGRLASDRHILYTVTSGALVRSPFSQS